LSPYDESPGEGSDPRRENNRGSSDLKRALQSPPTWVVLLLGLSLVVGACSDSGTQAQNDGEASTNEESVTVAPSYSEAEIVINVDLTDEGFEPSTVFLPAGRHVRLVLRNTGRAEHHFRVARLIPADVRWFLVPEIDEDEVESLSPEELERYGITDDIDDLEHVLHHLNPSFVPFRETSRAGITPLKNEVHGYAHAGRTELMTFFPLNTGRFVVEDVLHPEITGTVVVFEPPA
jgi:uncharacterized cupredoxin-like copper-binding protein